MIKLHSTTPNVVNNKTDYFEMYKLSVGDIPGG